MHSSHFIGRVPAFFLAGVAFALQCHGQTVVNDGFESGSFSTSWISTTSTSIQTGAGAAGSARSAALAGGTASRLAARFDAVQSGGSAVFTIDAAIRIQSTNTRQFQFQVSTSSGAVATNAPAINLRYQSGAWSAFNGTTWHGIAGLNQLTPGEWHRVRLTGRDWGSANARYDLEVSSAGGTSFTSAAGGLKIYHNSNSNAFTTKASYFVFTTEFDSNPGFSVDNVNAVVGAAHAEAASQIDPVFVAGATQSGPGNANLALDNNPATVSETTDVAGSFWEMELGRSLPVTRVQLLAPAGPGQAGILNGLVLRIHDIRGQVVYSQTIAGTVPGELWTVDLPPGTEGRIVRIELPESGLNGVGDRRVAVAEVKVFSPPWQAGGTNLALNKTAYMVRLTDSLPPAGYANDGNTSTTMETTTRTVDAYWETDLGEERALDHIRITGIDNSLDQYRLSRATLRLYDGNHESVFSQRLGGSSNVFDIVLPGPVAARYVRVGFENKVRSSPTNGIEWYLRIREVEAFGRPLAQTGIVSFSASTADSPAPGQPVQLSWQVDGVNELELYPGPGSVGAATNTNGTGTITVNPLVSTCYTLVAKTRTRTLVRHVTVRVAGQPVPPRLNEVVASNRLSFRDGFNAEPDWIEIHNPDAAQVDLTGYCLSDDPLQPAKWAFPAGTIIPGHGFLVVCASDRNLAGPDADGFLHARFALSSAGETLVLSTPGGAVVLDQLGFPAQDEDLAYGRTPQGAWSFIDPTPGSANVARIYQGFLLPPAFSDSRGIRTAGFQLVLTNPNPESQLFYSIDGSEPSVPYSAPVAVNTSRTVRATVRRDGWRSPRTVTHSYVFPSHVPTAAGMNATYASGSYLTRQTQGFQQLPVVSLAVPELPDDYIETEASAEFFLPGVATPVQVNCGLERFGGAWTEFAKKSYKLNFSSAYGARKLEAPLFNGFDRGLPVKEVFDSLELRAGNHDMVARGFYMSGRFIEDTTLAMGTLNPHGRFAHVFVNGSYWGMYDMRERMVDAFLAEYLGGAKKDYVVVRGNDNYENATFIPGTPDPPNRALWEYVRANRSSYQLIKDKVDLQSLIDFMLVWFYGNNENEFRCAGPVAAGSGFKFWLADSDGYLYSPNVGSALAVDRTDNAGPGGIFGSLVAEGHPDFKMLLADRIQKHLFNDGALTPARATARLNARMDEIYNAMVSECARWGYRTPENWATAADSIRTGLFPQRSANLLTQLRNRGLFPALNAPVFSQHGGSVAQGYPLQFAGVSGTVYFTLDGTDPRLPGGGIAPGALSWNGANQTMVSTGSTWKFWDRGSLPAANWNATAYNDSSWSSGAAPLGYGDSGMNTTVSFGPSSASKYPTTYFRRAFNVANPAQFIQLTLNLVRDDGAVVYLNGVEIARSNMPAGSIGYTTLALSGVGGSGETQVHSFTVPAGLLVTGTNVVAVELHQATTDSTDLRFDLSLNATASGTAAVIDSNTRVMARAFDGASWSALTDATFRVAWPLVANGPYLMDAWSASAPAGTHPPNMTFYQTAAAVPDPALGEPMENPWLLPYDRTSRSRVNGLGADGFSFINTSDPQAEPGSGFMGAAVLSLDTTGAQDVHVIWTGGTVLANTRDYGVRLQYRVGESTAFTDVISNGQPVEYVRNPVSGHSQVIGPVTLPADAGNKPLVQLRWKYHHRSGTTGSRAQLRVDNVQVTAGHPAPAELHVVSAPAAGQKGRTIGPVLVEARSETGALATGFNGVINLAISGRPVPLGGTTTRNASAGIAVFDDLMIDDTGEFVLSASSTGLEPGESDPPTRIAGFEAVILPRHIQGKGLVNDDRVPFAARFRLTGLRPNSVYRYANRFVTAADAEPADGAGNMIFTHATGFVRSLASPSFAAADLGSGHGEFTSDAAGTHEGWFVSEPTGNERFIPGGSVFPLLLLNDGEAGESTRHRLKLDDAVAVLSFGQASTQGSAVRGTSEAPGRSFIVLHDDPAGSGRPLAATPVEATGAAVDALYADFYQNGVAGLPGCWGTILPNNLAGGARLIEVRDASGTLLSSLSSPGGHRPTAGLSNGLTPTGVRITGAAEDAFARWQARHFTLDEMATGGIGAAMTSPVGDDVPNLLRFAFGMPPFAIDRSRLPSVSVVEAAPGDRRLRFRFHRLADAGGLSYQILTSTDFSSWNLPADGLLTNETVTPDPDGFTESVTRDLPLAPGDPHRALRLRVTRP